MGAVKHLFSINDEGSLELKNQFICSIEQVYRVHMFIWYICIEHHFIFNSRFLLNFYELIVLVFLYPALCDVLL